MLERIETIVMGSINPRSEPREWKIIAFQDLDLPKPHGVVASWYINGECQTSDIYSFKTPYGRDRKVWQLIGMYHLIDYAIRLRERHD